MVPVTMEPFPPSGSSLQEGRENEDLFLWLVRDGCAQSGRCVRNRLRCGATSHEHEGWYTMAGKTEQVKGQAKEAAGSLTGNKDLESEGKADRRAGEAKEKVGHAKDKLEEVIEKVEHKVGEVIDKAKDTSHRK